MCNSSAWHVSWWCISLFACNEQFCIYVGSLLFRVCGTFLVFVILICLVFFYYSKVLKQRFFVRIICTY